MRKTLILASQFDYHALAVKWAVEEFGGHAVIWDPSQTLVNPRTSISVMGAKPPVLFGNTDNGVQNLLDFDIVWNRRLELPEKPDALSELDASYARRETAEFNKNILAILSYKTQVVNAFAGQELARRKALQLVVAKSVGLNVPKTIISNDFTEIQDFQRAVGRAIVKPFSAMNWATDGGIIGNFTADLPHLTEEYRLSVSLCPVIVQERIERLYEARVVCFGEHVFAVEVVGNSLSDNLDSRIDIMKNTFKPRRIDVPGHIRHCCKAYLDYYSLEFGAFDLIVDKHGQWTFLECNESGQFLFLEHMVPDINILSSFAKWLLAIDGRATDLHADEPTLLEFDDFYDRKLSDVQYSQALSAHRRTPTSTTIDERSM